MATKWIPVVEQAAASLAQTDGSLSPHNHGRLIKIGGSDVWDMQREWTGMELVKWRKHKSLWSKCIRITFYVDAAAGLLPTFGLDLDPETPQAEYERIAEVYMTLLNLRRKPGQHS